jgi:dTDP-4-dehydrorhamnose 3,5-epimerase
VRFVPAPLAGAFVVELDRLEDERGFFARTFCTEEFRRHGLNPHVEQCSISSNLLRGTLRGMHYQASPYEEAKLVRCTRGAIFDVLVDLRSASPTRLKWFGVELSAGNRRALYVPEGFAHGFLTLAADSEVLYQISAPYRPEAQRGFRWDDPGVGIAWPEAATQISPRDRALPLLQAEART